MLEQKLGSRFITARKKMIEDEFGSLNAQQRKAVLATEGPLLLLAGAGSGKTTVLIHRIENLIRFGSGSDSEVIPEGVTEDDVSFLENYIKGGARDGRGPAERLAALNPAAPWSIIAITFTNKAAGELKDRLESKLGSSARDVWAMTFHSACCRILRRDIGRLGFTSDFTIYDTDDSLRVVKDVMKNRNIDDKTFPPRSVLSRISKAKDEMQRPGALAGQAESERDFRLQRIAEIYAEYQKRLTEANALDFDDIILHTVTLLQSHEDVRLYYQKKFRYVLVDEYQDTNNLQYLLTGLLAGGHQNICVVGDDDQSIYKFRGATIANILSFEKQYPNARVIRLEQNYRSTKSILESANSVISNNTGRKGKKLWTDNAAGGKVTLYEAETENDEARFIANTIIDGVSDGGNYKDYAVLYRTNAQSNAIENAFKRSGVPYRIIGGQRFYDRAEVRDMLAYLCVINNRNDDLRLRRIINRPARGIGEKTLDTAQRIALRDGLSLYEVISRSKAYPELERPAAKLMAFAGLIEDCAALLNKMELPEFYDELLVKTGYIAMLEEKNDEENKTRAEYVRELQSSIVGYVVNNEDDATLKGFLDETALYTDIEQYDKDANASVMMTIHSAKGLEFPGVFLTGMEDGLFPSSRSMNELDELEEERRLCYVAITRAREKLYLTLARQRTLYGRTAPGIPSRFIDELPRQYVEGEIKNRKTYVFDEADYRQDQDFKPRQYKKPQMPKAAPAGLGLKAPAVKADFKKGDIVVHKAFGNGMVVSVLPAGNDAMLEIAFDNVGTKKLMANYASGFMSKL